MLLVTRAAPEDAREPSCFKVTAAAALKDALLAELPELADARDDDLLADDFGGVFGGVLGGVTFGEDLGLDAEAIGGNLEEELE